MTRSISRGLFTSVNKHYLCEDKISMHVYACARVCIVLCQIPLLCIIYGCTAKPQAIYQTYARDKFLCLTFVSKALVVEDLMFLSPG